MKYVVPGILTLLVIFAAELHAQPNTTLARAENALKPHAGGRENRLPRSVLERKSAQSKPASIFLISPVPWRMDSD